MHKFTVITICLNAGKEIGDTIASVLRQTCTDFEYIIKDGISKDDTVRVAESFAPAFSEKGISYRILSQEDCGIYDAMNQATREAQGEWVIYMNAGDQFADKTVLEQLIKSGCLENADVVYGDRILKNRNLYCYWKAYSLDRFGEGLPFGHQSVFARREVLGTSPYSLKYRICSDYHCFLQMYCDKRRFIYIPIVISIYDVNGISSNQKAKFEDIIQILKDMPNPDKEAIQKKEKEYRKYKLEQWLHRHLFQYIPQEYRTKRRMKKKKESGWKTAEEMFGSGSAD